MKWNIERNLCEFLVKQVIAPEFYRPGALCLDQANAGIDDRIVFLVLLRIQVRSRVDVILPARGGVEKKLHIAANRSIPGQAARQHRTRCVGQLTTGQCTLLRQINGAATQTRIVDQLVGDIGHVVAIFGIYVNIAQEQVEAFGQPHLQVDLDTSGNNLLHRLRNKIESRERIELEILEFLVKEGEVQERTTVKQAALETQFPGIDGLRLKAWIEEIKRIRIVPGQGQNRACPVQVYAAGLEAATVGAVNHDIVTGLITQAEYSRHFIIVLFDIELECGRGNSQATENRQHVFYAT